MARLKLWNTLTRSADDFEIPAHRPVNLYTCGPTVYDFAHIGNLRSYISADTLRRALLAHGASVRWVMNITDVDDKTIRKTIAEFGPHATVADLRTVTDRYLEAFKKNLAEVNIPTGPEDVTFIRVADVIPEIVGFVKELMRKGFAYATEDGIYFSIEKYEQEIGGYGGLVGPGFLEGKKIGARVKVDEYEKENLSDFALWKARGPEDGNIFWSDPSGELMDGRPGWHIECSVVNNVAFEGKPTDIHTGGVDLVFPHHTNEIAQSEALLGKGNFVHLWTHSEHLMVSGRKMAKREGNFFTLEDLKIEMPEAGPSFRYLVLQTHYRTQMNFLKDSMEGARNALSRLNSRAAQFKDAPVSKERMAKFAEALANDLNTSQALAAMEEAGSVNNTPMLEVLGLVADPPLAQEPLRSSEIPAEAMALLVERTRARMEKRFADSDELRAKLEALGYTVKDTPEGPELYRS